MTTVGVLGDSISALTYFDAVPQLRWHELAYQALRVHEPSGWTFTDYSANGLKASDYLTGGSVPPATWKGNHDVYFVFLVANEGLVAPMRTDTDSLVAEIKDGGGKAVLVTLYPVDYAGLHWRQDQGDKDATIIALNQVYRDVHAADPTVGLCDLWQHVTNLGEWDYRLRNYPLVGGAVTDQQYWGPDSAFDGDGSGGSDDPLWYTEIHPNPYGSQLIANAVVAYAESSLVATTTFEAMRATAKAQIEALTPDTNSEEKFLIHDSMGDFREWAQEQPQAASRRFQVANLFSYDDVQIHNNDQVLEPGQMEVVVAYRTDHRFADDDGDTQSSRDLQDVIEQDRVAIDKVVGINATAYTNACTYQADFSVEETGAVTFLVLNYTFIFYRSA